MSLTVTIKAMLASGCSAEQLANVVEAHEQAQLEIQKEKRAKRAAQKRVERERRLMSPNVAATSSDNVRHDATTCDISSPSSPSPDGFPPAYIVQDYTPPSFTPTSTPSPRANKGKRLPEDWQPTVEDYSFADRLGVGGEVDTFRDYWNSQPGQRGVKLDWSATWRNWCRRAAQNKPKKSQRETPMETGLRIMKEMENAEYQRSNPSRDPLVISVQRQPSGQGDIPSPSGSQLRGLLGIDASITMPPKDWFDLEE
jgi:hypothetical protein